MKFERKTYDTNGKEVYDEVEFDDIAAAKANLEISFRKDENSARLEEFYLANGKYSISLKTRENKIIVQYKTK